MEARFARVLFDSPAGELGALGCQMASRDTMKKRHHFRPVLHLRHFANQSGLIWTYDRTGAAAPFQQSPNNIGYERLLYSPKEEGAKPDDALENWFEVNVDRPAAEVLKRAIATDTLDNSDGSIVSRFIAAQDMRTPKVRDDLLDLFQMGMDQQFAQWRADPGELRAAILRDTGEDISVDDLAAHLADTSVIVNNVAWFDFIVSQIDVAARRLFAMGWSLLHAPAGIEFLTNDVGIVKCLGRIDRPCPFVLGFAAGRTHWVFPLSAEVAFAILPTPGGVHGEASAMWVAAINAQSIADAQRFVYSRTLLADPWGEIHPLST